MSGLMFTMVGEDDEANIVVFVPGQSPLVAHSSHPNFMAIVKAAIAKDEGIVELFDIAEAVATKFQRLSERITTANGNLYLDGEPMNGVIVDHVLRSMEAGLTDWEPLVLFIEALSTNPNPQSVDQLYPWLKAEGFTIDTAGMIVGYKGVKALSDGQYESVRSGQAIVNGQVFKGAIPNNAGDIVEMPRSEVQFDPSVGCSTGLHVGTYEYASGWARGAVLEVRVNPRDVISVPTDCGAQKMRVCRYTVVDVIDQPYSAPVIGADYDADEGLYEAFDLWGDFEDDDLYDDPFGF